MSITQALLVGAPEGEEIMPESRIDLDAAERLMEMTLKNFHSKREQEGNQSADGLRRQFAGAKFMLEALLGVRVYCRALHGQRMAE